MGIADKPMPWLGLEFPKELPIFTGDRGLIGINDTQRAVLMATESYLTNYQDDRLQDVLQNSLQEQSGAVRAVARQPILDQRSRVYGYELLFWNGVETVFGPESEQAVQAMLGNALVVGVEHLACGKLAFVHCTADSLSEEWVRALNPDLTVLEVREDCATSDAFLKSCAALKRLGFQIVLEDYTGKIMAGELLELADYVKIDISEADAKERKDLISQATRHRSRAIAKNVHTQDAYREVSGEGFELFQGYYFCRPRLVRDHKIPPNRMAQLEILRLVQQDPIDLDRLSQLVMKDASLTYGLLRFVNSPLFAVRQEVTSIRAALLLMGEVLSRRVTILAIAGEFNADQPLELLRMAFERGRFCELAADILGLLPSEQYLIGMVSMFPAMLRISMEDLAHMLPLRAEACDALLGKGNPEGALLDFLVARDDGEWAACEAILETHGLTREQVMMRLGEAAIWSSAAIQSAKS
jgi:EAL and modified HD-GYP domain-containing signal transduction protein